MLGFSTLRRPISSKLLILCFAWFLTTGLQPAFAKRVEQVTFASADGTKLSGYLVRANSIAATSPTVIALHGCGGLLNTSGDKLGPRHRSWATILSEAGYNVLFPDSFGSRGHKSLCKIKPRPVKQRERVADVEGALGWLKTQTFVDGNAISVLGWSNGGGTAVRVAQRPFGRQLAHVIAFYPGCTAMLRKSTPAPVTRLKIIMGAADDWTAPAPCKELAKKWNVPIVLYDGAYHSFDTPRRAVRERDGLAFTTSGASKAHTGTNDEARRKAIAEVLSTLTQR